MSIFASHDTDSMNENDVDGDIVRAFCRALGYSHGHPTVRFRTQTPLKYDRFFLGHKTKKDPELRGKPDFVCEVVGVSRWVIESKAPSIQLTLDDSHQAYTYAAHPEIAAEFYVLTNGREFRIYRIGNPDNPIFDWPVRETEIMLPTIEGILGPKAMQARVPKVDVGKPLAPGLASSVRLVGGSILYREVEYVPAIPGLNLNGMQSNVVDGLVNRNEDGQIVASVDVKFPFAAMDELHRSVGLTPYIFRTSSEFISTDRENPTLMQNTFHVKIPAGTMLPTTPLSAGGISQRDSVQDSFTQALGYIEEDWFKGMMLIETLYTEYWPGTATPVSLVKATQRGEFNIRFQY